MKKGFTYILLLLSIALVVLAGVGYFAYKNGQVNSPSQQRADISLPQSAQR